MEVASDAGLTSESVVVSESAMTRISKSVMTHSDGISYSSRSVLTGNSV